MALTGETQDSSLFATGLVVGCIVPTTQRPAFCIPLIVPLGASPLSSNTTYIQRVGADGNVQNFDIFGMANCDCYSLKDPYARVSIGDPRVFVVCTRQDKFATGTRERLASFVESLVPALPAQSLTKLAFADFCQNADLMLKAAAQSYNDKQRELGSAVAKSWFIDVVLYRRIQRSLITAGADLGRAKEVEREIHSVRVGTSGKALVVELPSALKWLENSRLNNALRAERHLSRIVGLRSVKVIAANEMTARPKVRKVKIAREFHERRSGGQTSLPDVVDDFLSSESLVPPFDISTEAITRLLAAYNVGEPLAFKGISSHFAANFLVHTSQGHHVLTMFKKNTSLNRINFAIQFMMQLQSSGLPCPVPICDRHGRHVTSIENHPAVLAPLLDGMNPFRPKAEQCGAMGGLLGRIHAASFDFKPIRPEILSWDGLRLLYKETEASLNKIEHSLTETIGLELDYLESTIPSGLPHGPIHANVIWDNVLMLGDEISGITGFYSACTGPFLYDVAVCLNDWCFEFDHSLNVTKARAFLTRYQAVRELSPAERAALPQIARAAAVIRCLASAYAWLILPKSTMVRSFGDPRTYNRTLRFHQKVKSFGEYVGKAEA